MTAGSIVVQDEGSNDGKIGVSSSGEIAVFDSAGECAECCVTQCPLLVYGCDLSPAVCFDPCDDMPMDFVSFTSATDTWYWSGGSSDATITYDSDDEEWTITIESRATDPETVWEGTLTGVTRSDSDIISFSATEISETTATCGDIWVEVMADPCDVCEQCDTDPGDAKLYDYWNTLLGDIPFDYLYKDSTGDYCLWVWTGSYTYYSAALGGNVTVDTEITLRYEDKWTYANVYEIEYFGGSAISGNDAETYDPPSYASCDAGKVAIDWYVEDDSGTEEERYVKVNM